MSDLKVNPAAVTRVVLDTNVSLALWLFADPTLRELQSALESGRLLWVVSAAMLGELWHELMRPQRCERLGLTEASVRRILDAVPCELVAEKSPPIPGAHGLRCTDPKDQMFIDLAVAYQIPLLLSRDRAVLKLKKRASAHGLSVCSPEKGLVELLSLDGTAKGLNKK